MSSSSAILRALLISALSVIISIPGAIVVPQEVTKPFLPLTSTKQTQQEPYGFNSSSSQRVGISMPFLFASSRIVIPASLSIFFPLSITSIIFNSYSLVTAPNLQAL